MSFDFGTGLARVAGFSTFSLGLLGPCQNLQAHPSADVVYGLGGDPPREIIHFEVQSGPDAELHKHVLVINCLLFQKYEVPVHSIVLLLRAAAAHSNLNGSIRYTARPDRGKMEFGYEVVRLWERPSESLLAGGLETVPLATLGKLPEGVSVEDGVAGVLARVLERLTREATPERVKALLTAAYFLTGLRVARHKLLPMFRGALRTMHESDTYQAVLEEGGINALKRAVLRQGGNRFGPPSEEVKLVLEGITDLDRLDRMLDRVHDVSGWQEVLETP